MILRAAKVELKEPPKVRFNVLALEAVGMVTLSILLVNVFA